MTDFNIYCWQCHYLIKEQDEETYKQNLIPLDAWSCDNCYNAAMPKEIQFENQLKEELHLDIDQQIFRNIDGVRKLKYEGELAEIKRAGQLFFESVDEEYINQRNEAIRKRTLKGRRGK